MRAGDDRQRPSSGQDDVSGDRVELLTGAGTDATNCLDQRIQEVREQIAAGTYLTPHKIDVVVEQLHAELFGAMPQVA